MAKYTVTYKCGHTGTVELFGKESERRHKIAFYEENYICPECYEAEQAARIDAENKEYNLPALEGSEKQIAWAEKIRVKFINVRKEFKFKEENRALFEGFCDEFFAETSAKAWIERETSNDNKIYFKYGYIDYKKAHANN